MYLRQNRWGSTRKAQQDKGRDAPRQAESALTRLVMCHLRQSQNRRPGDLSFGGDPDETIAQDVQREIVRNTRESSVFLLLSIVALDLQLPLPELAVAGNCSCFFVSFGIC